MTENQTQGSDCRTHVLCCIVLCCVVFDAPPWFSWVPLGTWISLVETKSKDHLVNLKEPFYPDRGPYPYHCLILNNLSPDTAKATEPTLNYSPLHQPSIYGLVIWHYWLSWPTDRGEEYKESKCPEPGLWWLPLVLLPLASVSPWGSLFSPEKWNIGWSIEQSRSLLAFKFYATLNHRPWTCSLVSLYFGSFICKVSTMGKIKCRYFSGGLGRSRNRKSVKIQSLPCLVCLFQSSVTQVPGL